jgi:hypothetical protein
LPIFDPEKNYNPSSPPVLSRFRDGRELVEENERSMEETVMAYLRVRYKQLPGENAVLSSDQ